mgnify:CR=1 FL=1
MAEPQPNTTQETEEEDIPILTLPNQFSGNWGHVFLIAAILIAEAIVAYTVVALNYNQIYEMVYDRPANLGVFYEIEEITVNPSGTNGSGFLVVSVGIQVDDESSVRLIEQKQVIIRDAIISLLSRRTVEELSGIDAKNEVKREIGIIINNIIEKQAVKDLFFTKYVMQVY